MTGRQATAWILELASGERLGFTDHDAELWVDGVTCQPGTGFTPSAAQAQLGFAHDNRELGGALDSDRLTPKMIENGELDGARITTWAVDWTTEDAELSRTQMIRSVTRETNGRFTAEVVGLSAALHRVTGRVVSRLCGAQFGDANCGLDPANYAPGTGCARSFAACKAFGNTLNYRGFPHLIGDDAIIQGPLEGVAREGGSRYGSTPGV